VLQLSSKTLTPFLGGQERHLAHKNMCIFSPLLSLPQQIEEDSHEIPAKLSQLKTSVKMEDDDLGFGRRDVLRSCVCWDAGYVGVTLQAVSIQT